MFPQTAKARKRLWICSLARKIGKDIQPIQSSHVETVCQLVRKEIDKDGSAGIIEAEDKRMKKINYRKEEIPDCGCIYG